MDGNKLIMEKVDRLEHHFRVYKEDMTDVKDSIKDLKTAIIGNNINGNRGFLHLINEIDTKVQNLSDENLLLKEDMKTVKWVTRGFMTGLIGFVFWLFQK